MEPWPVEMTYDILLTSGESISLPQRGEEIVGPGHWILSIQPADEIAIRDHSAFLSGYSAEDEGLYDGYPAR
jgi:hypothetical protein